MSLNVDDLLKEFDDLPGGQASGAARPAAPQSARNGVATPLAPQSSMARTPVAPQSSMVRSSTPTSTSLAGVGSSSRVFSASRGKKDDLESLLSDLDFGGTPNNSMNGRNNPSVLAAAAAAVQKLSGETSAPSRKSSTVAAKQKCTGVFVAGTGFPRGRMGAVGALTCCDALRCTKCDFRVAQFDNFDWDDDIDYLFFRNNFPTEEKLAVKMRRRPGTVAYCCQCSWLSATEQTKLDFSSEVRWVCAGHSSD